MLRNEIFVVKIKVECDEGVGVGEFCFSFKYVVLLIWDVTLIWVGAVVLMMFLVEVETDVVSVFAFHPKKNPLTPWKKVRPYKEYFLTFKYLFKELKNMKLELPVR